MKINYYRQSQAILLDLVNLFLKEPTIENLIRFIKYYKKTLKLYLEGKIKDEELQSIGITVFIFEEKLLEIVDKIDERFSILESIIDVTNPDLTEEQKKRLIKNLINLSNDLINKFELQKQGIILKTKTIKDSETPVKELNNFNEAKTLVEDSIRVYKKNSTVENLIYLLKDIKAVLNAYLKNKITDKNLQDLISIVFENKKIFNKIKKEDKQIIRLKDLSYIKKEDFNEKEKKIYVKNFIKLINARMDRLSLIK